MSNKMLKPDEVCELLAISYNTLLRLLNEQSITGYKVGGQWRFYQIDIDAYVRSCKVRAVTPMRPASSRSRQPQASACGYVPGMKVV